MDGPGTLRASFLYAEQINGHVLSKFCPTVHPEIVPQEMPVPPLTPSGLAIDVAAKLVETGVTSLIDAASMRMRPKATTLDTVVPIDGFFRADGSPAIDNAVLILHNGADDKATEASFVLSLAMVVSADRSAFKFRVSKWDIHRFLRPHTGEWLQRNGERDWIIRIEFLTPGSTGFGVRSVFVEQAFQGVTLDELKNEFLSGKDLAWMSVPSAPAVLVGTQPATPDLFLPTNIHITIIETTEPNLFASWLTDALASTKGDIATAASGGVKGLLSNFAKSDDLNLLEYSSNAFSTYKTSWEKLRDLKASEPAAPPDGAQNDVLAKYKANHASWAANVSIQSQEVDVHRKLAINSFQKAGVTWPGNLPV